MKWICKNFKFSCENFRMGLKVDFDFEISVEVREIYNPASLARTTLPALTF